MRTGQRSYIRAIRNKLNMVIGAFFSEIGNWLLSALTPAVDRAEELQAHLGLQGRWTKQDFLRATAFARALDHSIDIDRLDLCALRRRLTGHRDFMVRLLENPLLFEHTEFLFALVVRTHPFQGHPSAVVSDMESA